MCTRCNALCDKAREVRDVLGEQYISPRHRCLKEVVVGQAGKSEFDGRHSLDAVGREL